MVGIAKSKQGVDDFMAQGFLAGVSLFALAGQLLFASSISVRVFLFILGVLLLMSL